MKNKPEDNKYFHYYNANPTGKETKDCTYRALSLFLDKSWDEVAKMDAEFYLNHGAFVYTSEIEYSLPKFAVDVFLQELDNCKLSYQFNIKDGIYTLQDFIDKKASPEKIYICPLLGHVVAIKNNKVWDTWDSSKSGIENIYEKA